VTLGLSCITELCGGYDLMQGFQFGYSNDNTSQNWVHTLFFFIAGTNHISMKKAEKEFSRAQ
jgi:hypothetical protein